VAEAGRGGEAGVVAVADDDLVLGDALVASRTAVALAARRLERAEAVGGDAVAALVAGLGGVGFVACSRRLVAPVGAAGGHDHDESREHGDETDPVPTHVLSPCRMVRWATLARI
jgi:hypothetical protein